MKEKKGFFSIGKKAREPVMRMILTVILLIALVIIFIMILKGRIGKIVP